MRRRSSTPYRENIAEARRSFEKVPKRPSSFWSITIHVARKRSSSCAYLGLRKPMPPLRMSTHGRQW